MASKRTLDHSSCFASSSSSTQPYWTYDVFLSFRGEDTRKNFTDHLYAALVKAGIHPFRDDDELQRGREISSELLKSIEGSRISIVVFSKNYSSSRWCLDELVKIIECKKTLGQLVLPIFYDVNPSDVRHQTGCFGEAFGRHEEHYVDEMEKVEVRRAALVEVANLSGWDLQNVANGHEEKFIRKIVNEVLCVLKHTFLDVAVHPVGIDSRVEHIKSLLSVGSDDVRMIGIYGMGGIGKTTIAKAVYNHIFLQFVGSCCFLENVRVVAGQVNGLVQLQELLLCELLGRKNLKIVIVDRGINLMKERLRSKKVLIVLDDVDQLSQLRTLAGNHDWFGPGSRIIITTRDEELLKSLKVDERYMVEELNHEVSLQLFSWHAFRETNPLESYAELANGIVRYAGGLPLALEVLGSHLFEEDMEVWESAFDLLRQIPHEEIQKKLQISFDALGNGQFKDIFLDIACFFIGMDKDCAITILNACDLCAKYGISVLIRRCLLKIEQNKLTMHDLLRDMGREIIRQESPKELGKRSRLWFHKHISDVLGKNKGTEKVEGVVVTGLPMAKKIQWSNKAFAGMHNLRLLQINHVHLSGNFKHLLKELRWLCWHYCPLEYLPYNFHPEKLIILDMQFSKIKTLWKDGKQFKSLKTLNLSNSKCLTKSPIFCALLMLEELLLEGCTGLMELHESIGLLDKLIHLNLKDCMNLRHLPGSICKLKSVECLNLTGCAKLEEFPEYLEYMESLTELLADGTAIKQLPFSIGLLKNLRSFKYSRQLTTKSLRRRFLPSSFFGLRSLTSLYLNDCNLSERDFPADFRSLSLLRMLSLAGNNFHNHLPDCFSHLSRLEKLYLHDCRNLKAISDLPPNLMVLCVPNCASLETISDISKLKTLFITLNHMDDSTQYRPFIFNTALFFKRSENSEGLNRFQGVRLTPSDRRNNLENPRQHLRGIYGIMNNFHIGNNDNYYDKNFFSPTNTQRHYSFSYKTTGSSLISFKVPVLLKEEIDEYVEGLDVFVVYYRDGDEESCLMPSVIITNKTNCINLTHTPRFFAIPSSCGDYVWHIFIEGEDRIESGDQFEISVNMPSPFKVKQCVVLLLTRDKYSLDGIKIVFGRKRKPDHPRRMMSDVLHNRTSVAPPLEEASHRPASEGPLVPPPSEGPLPPYRPPSVAAQQLPCTQPPRLPSVRPPSVAPQQLSSSAYEPSADPSTSSQPTLGHVSSSSTSTRRGRGCAKGIKEWGTGKKLDIQFDGNYCPIGDNVAKLTTQLGIIVRNGNIVPLTFVDWNSVPDDIIDAIWKDVKDNLNLCPEEYKPICMKNCNSIWKDHKNKLKAKYFKPRSSDPNMKDDVPMNVVPSQWEQLVEYWHTSDAEKIASRNAKNRRAHGIAHTTRRTTFSQIRHEMTSKGESTDKMNVWLMTRRVDDPEVIQTLDEFNRQLSMLPEDGRTMEARNAIFHELIGHDRHGYCRTYGRIVPRRVVYKDGAGPSQSTPQPSTIDQIRAELRDELREEIRAEFSTQLQQMRAEMMALVSQGASVDLNRQVPDASSGHRVFRESAEDENPYTPPPED